jgi:hypothetical protein
MRRAHIRVSIGDFETLCGINWRKPEADPMVLLAHLAVHLDQGRLMCDTCLERARRLRS